MRRGEYRGGGERSLFIGRETREIKDRWGHSCTRLVLVDIKYHHLYYFCVQNVDCGRQYYFGDWLFEVTRWNGEEGYAEIKDGGVMIFNQFILIA